MSADVRVFVPAPGQRPALVAYFQEQGPNVHVAWDVEAAVLQESPASQDEASVKGVAYAALQEAAWAYVNELEPGHWYTSMRCTPDVYPIHNGEGELLGWEVEGYAWPE